MRDKAKNIYLMSVAEDVIKSTDAVFSDKSKLQIPKSFNGQIAAFGVAIAMSGLKPAFAFYYQDGDAKVCLRLIIDIVAQMIDRDEKKNMPVTAPVSFNNAEQLFKYVLTLGDSDTRIVQKEVVDCAIALKQVIRTYNLV